MLGRKCWELKMKMQGKGVWKSTKRKKGVFIKVRRPKNSLEERWIKMLIEIGNLFGKR